MRRLIIGGLLIAILGLVSASRAKADTFTYTFGGNTFVWQLPASPTIGAGDYETGHYFDTFDVPYTENGVAQAPGAILFFSSPGGGFEGLGLNTFGPQLYSGTEQAPTFIPGTYHLNNGSLTGPLDTLVISSPVSSPEPSSLMLIGSGLLSLLGLARKKIHA
jgi:PEP-CTERM motif